MEFPKKQFNQSIVINMIIVFFKKFLSFFKSSYTFEMGKRFFDWYTNVFLEKKAIKLFYNTAFISELWYKSYFYRIIMYRIRKISAYIPKAGVDFKGSYVGIFLALVLLIPDKLWSNLLLISLFLALVLFYISRSIRQRKGTVFVLVNIVMLFFILLSKIALPGGISSTTLYLIDGIDFFFLVSFSTENYDDLKDVTEILFVAAIVLCMFAYIQNAITSSAANVSFYDGVNLGEVLVLIFPFVFAYSNEFQSGKRKLIYMALIFIIFVNAIMVTGSKAAFIGFAVEMLIFILVNPKYLPFVIILIPLGLNTIMENFRHMWEATTSYGNIFNNVVLLFKKFWNTGFGVDSQKIIEMYNLKNIEKLESESVHLISNAEINGVYVKFVFEIGAVFIIGFMFYILKLAHSTLIRLFTAEKKYRRFFAAGLSMLIGISVSSFFESTMFSPRTMIIYWGMLGILRAVRIMSL